LMGRLNVSLGILNVTTRTLLSFPRWVSVITAAGQCSGEILSSFNRTRSRGCRLGMSSAIVDAAACPGVSRMTSLSELLKLLVSSPTGMSVTFDVSEVNGRYLGEWLKNYSVQGNYMFG
jgi:hypothetical protein